MHIKKRQKVTVINPVKADGKTVVSEEEIVNLIKANAASRKAEKDSGGKIRIDKTN